MATISLQRAFLAAVLMIATAIYLGYIRHDENVPLQKNLADFPKQIGQWSGVAGSFDRQVYDVLGVDDSLLITYHGPENQIIQLYVGYYQSQRKGNLIHSPRHCMPGAGWNITKSEIINLPVSTNNNNHIEVVQLTIEQQGQKQIALYWFQSRGRFIASEYFQKIYLVWDAIFKNRTDGAFVRLLTPVKGKGEAAAAQSLKTFATDLVPLLEDFLPGPQLSHQDIS